MAASLARRLVLGIYAAIIVVPLVVVVAGSFKTTQQLFRSPFGLPSSLAPTNYRTVLTDASMSTAFVNSVIVTGAAVALTLAIGSLASYGLARIPGWRGWVLYGFLVLGMAVPAQSNMIPQYVLFQNLGLLDSRVGLILIEIVAALPVAVFILTGFMRTLPRELFEAGLVDGAGPWRTYRSIALPVSLPSLAATAIFLFVIQWNDLLYPLLFIHDPTKTTLPLALLNFQGEFLTNYPLLFTGVIVASTPLVIAYVLLQRYFVAGMTAGSVKG
ncbi:carbohydrate ABC transporter permease [Phycicoccus duodecadis]|uniref:Carbohydrate ABC transporter membrane protein 2 (CUT1 family) n=1 Tax=Phycicoccus duodecadis TaxID=173053 RepID=A0A2N3YHQ9_9MICO|nr:carbohydrate ABC transporter permease [Phycicoccus duodecadis]PKW26386.1 carbohydrate ABC transporter membrane protein 2 (CUT1 family) [Phycicoccus duodecadis]